MDSFSADGRDEFRDDRSKAGTMLTTGLAPVGTRRGVGTSASRVDRDGRRAGSSGSPQAARSGRGRSTRCACASRSTRPAAGRTTGWPSTTTRRRDPSTPRSWSSTRPVRSSASLDDSSWNVTLYESGMLDGEQDGNVRIPAGTFATSGQDLELHATFSCGDTPSATLTATPAAEPLPAPLAVRHGGWTEGYDREKRRRRAQPFTVAAHDGHFVALDWDPDTGWTELTSRDGRRWSSWSIPATDGLPKPTEGLDARLWSVGEGLMLTAVVPSATGNARAADLDAGGHGRLGRGYAGPDGGRSGGADAGRARRRARCWGWARTGQDRSRACCGRPTTGRGRRWPGRSGTWSRSRARPTGSRGWSRTRVARW